MAGCLASLAPEMPFPSYTKPIKLSNVFILNGFPRALDGWLAGFSSPQGVAHYPEPKK